MTDTVDRVAAAMIERWKIGAHPASSPDLTYWQDMAQAAVAATFAEINAALEKRDWCPCCGYDGLWPRGAEGERGWKEFLEALTDRPNPG